MFEIKHKSAETGFLYETDRYVCLMQKDDTTPPDNSDMNFERMVKDHTESVCGDANLEFSHGFYVLKNYWVFPAERIEAIKNFIGPHAFWKRTTHGSVWAYNADKSKQGLAMPVPARRNEIVVYTVGPSTFTTFEEATEFATMMGLTIQEKKGI